MMEGAVFQDRLPSRLFYTVHIASQHRTRVKLNCYHRPPQGICHLGFGGGGITAPLHRPLQGSEYKSYSWKHSRGGVLTHPLRGLARTLSRGGEALPRGLQGRKRPSPPCPRSLPPTDTLACVTAAPVKQLASGLTRQPFSWPPGLPRSRLSRHRAPCTSPEAYQHGPPATPTGGGGPPPPAVLC
jgi:hypothetical protein